MRLIVIVLAVSVMALTFAATPSHADSVTGTATEVSESCFQYDLTVANDRGGPSISGVIVFATWTSPNTDCATEVQAPSRWSEEVLDETADSLLAKWDADKSRFGVKGGASLSGFIVQAGACPLTVELWTTFKKNGVQTAAGTFVIPCP
jgi:hypothetical protein